LIRLKAKLQKWKGKQERKRVVKEWCHHSNTNRGYMNCGLKQYLSDLASCFPDYTFIEHLMYSRHWCRCWKRVREQGLNFNEHSSFLGSLYGA
jgi:hypothetical protein